jgi:hypothetical protein
VKVQGADLIFIQVFLVQINRRLGAQSDAHKLISLLVVTNISSFVY